MTEPTTDLDNLETLQKVEASNEEQFKVADEPTYEQERDADLSNITLNGRHFLIKVPQLKTDSGLILSESVQKEMLKQEDNPGFVEDIVVVKKSPECKDTYEVGDMVLLSPHFAALEFVEDNVLYYMIHEDFVLATKKPSK